MDTLSSLFFVIVEFLLVASAWSMQRQERQDWLFDLRQRYSWQSILHPNINYKKRLIIYMLISVISFIPVVYYPQKYIIAPLFVISLFYFFSILSFYQNLLIIELGILTLLFFWHLGLISGWQAAFLYFSKDEIPRLFYISLFIASIIMFHLWYQLSTSTFSHTLKRIYWIVYYLFRNKKYSRHFFLDSFLSSSAFLENRWHRRLALWAVQFFSHRWIQRLYPHVFASWRDNAIRDLGRLGTNAQTPQETNLVLQALLQLAKRIPVYTHGVNTPMVQMAEATSQTLWPLEASDREAFSKAIQVFRTLFRRWVHLVHERENPEEAASQVLNTESPLLPYITRLGYTILERNDSSLLLPNLLKIFSTTIVPHENHLEARALFLLGLRALQQKQWDALLHLVNKLREYARCVPENAGHIRTPIPDVPFWIPVLEDVLPECEGTFWLLGLLAMIAVEYPGARPWVRRSLSTLFDLEDEEEAAILCMMLVKAADFFTGITLEPEVARAVCAFPEAVGVACGVCDGD